MMQILIDGIVNHTKLCNPNTVTFTLSLKRKTKPRMLKKSLAKIIGVGNGG